MRWRPIARRVALTLCLAATSSGCTSGAGEGEVAGAPAAAWPAGLARPADAAEAERLKTSGTRWTNQQSRQLYLERVAEIAGADAKARADGVTAEERARRAFATRHAARMTARAMMSDPSEVAALQERDRAKYGDPDGPTFEQLVEKARAKGLEGDALYESIVESAQRTDAGTNRGMGL